MYSLWQDLSLDTIIFDLVTLTLKFDLLLKNFNLGHNFLIRSGRSFILHVYSLRQDLSNCNVIFDLLTLTLKFDLLLKNFNLCCLVMAAARRTSSSDNSYFIVFLDTDIQNIYLGQMVYCKLSVVHRIQSQCAPQKLWPWQETPLCIKDNNCVKSRPHPSCLWKVMAKVWELWPRPWQNELSRSW